MRRMRTQIAAAAAGLLLAASAGLATAADDQIQTYQGHRYACTGVGSDARNDPRWDGFPLKMVFTTKNGNFLSDISATLSNDAGDVVLVAQCDGPWLLAELEAGRYTARLIAQGQYEQSVDFRVGGDGQTQVVVPFSGVN